MEKTDTKQLQKGRKNSEHILPFCIPKKIKNCHNRKVILNLSDAGNYGMTEEYRREIENLTMA